MGTQQVQQLKHLRDVTQGRKPSRLRLLAPLRYLSIHNSEKSRYDFRYPVIFAIIACGGYWILEPRIALFGDAGLLRFARDLLVMAVPFLVGALAVVATGLPGKHFDERLRGVDLTLDGRPLTLRRFVCYLLGYLSFLGLLTLGAVVAATLLHDSVVHWTAGSNIARITTEVVGTFVLSLLLSALSITVFWALYFLTDVVNDID